MIGIKEVFLLQCLFLGGKVCELSRFSFAC